MHERTDGEEQQRTFQWPVILMYLAAHPFLMNYIRVRFCYRYSSLQVQWVSCHIFSMDPVGFYLSRCQIHIAKNKHVINSVIVKCLGNSLSP